jgi:predicted porin
MKKHLIAAAVAAAVAVPAMAQNVTLSGYVEAGYQDAKINNVSSSNATTGIFGSPRVVISGSEDLGGGLKAGFRLESTIDITTGRFGAQPTTTAVTGGASTYPDGTGYFDRGAEINLSGAFGMVRLGKFDHLGGEDNDLNAIGNVALFSGTTSMSNVSASVEVGTDRDGTFAYRTPTIDAIGGFVEFAVTPKDTAANAIPAAAAASTDDDGITSVHARGTVGGVSYRIGAAKRKIVAGAGTDEVLGVAVSYNFGFMTAALAHQSFDSPLANTDRTETVASANIPLGNGLDLRVLYKNYEHDTSANNVETYGFGVVKALSKRTSAMAFVRSTDKENQATKDRQVYLGVGHSF